MKAARLNGWGQPIQIEDVPQPEPGADEVLVRIHAASVNPIDGMIQAGYMQGYVNVPLTMGTDFAGEVVQAGEGVTHVKPGDAVYGLVPMHSGTFAEYTVAKAHEVTHKPQTLNYVEAAGVPLASLAAYQSLHDLGQAQAGDRILIIGAAGAVGACALQMAKELGASVVAVDVPEKASFVRELGPDRFVDAKTERFEDAGPFDLVLDYVTGDAQQRALNLLQPGGRYVTSLFLPENKAEFERKGIRAASLATQPRADQLDDLARRIDAGRLKIFYNSTYPLEEINTALEYRGKTSNPGKTVIVIR